MGGRFLGGPSLARGVPHSILNCFLQPKLQNWQIFKVEKVWDNRNILNALWKVGPNISNLSG